MDKSPNSINLPSNASDFIELVVKKMGYRRKVRAEVKQELAAHFEDELRDCSDQRQKQEKAQKIIEQFGDAKMLGILLRRAKKRCRPFWRTAIVRSFQTLLILIIALVFYCIYLSLGRPTIKIDYVKKLTEIAHPKVDESQNAAILYEQATASYKEPPVLKVEQTEPNDLEPITKDLLDVIKDKKVYELTQTELAALEEWIGSNSKAIEFYIEGSNKPYYWRLHESTANLLEMEMPELGQVRRLSVLLSWRAKLKAEQGDIDGAFDDLLAVYRVGMHLKGPRTLVEQLVGIAIQALAVNNARQIVYSHRLDGQKLSYLQNELQSLANKDNFKFSFKAESFLMMDFIQRSYTDDGKGSGRMSPAGIMQFMSGYYDDYNDILESYIKAIGVSLISTNRHNMENMTQDFFDFLDKRAELTPWQSRNTPVNEKYQIDDWSFIRKVRYWPMRYLMPAFGAVHRLNYRIKTDVQSVPVIIAALRYKADTGQYPQDLTELQQAGYINEIPTDPFSNEAIKYKITDDGFKLYSVGLNFTDEGGEVHRDKNGSINLWDEDDGDVVFWPVEE